MAIYAKPKTTVPTKNHKHYPYLLKDCIITRKNQVWSIDITYIRMKNGYMYMVGIIDWYTRKLLSWKLSNTMDVDFCISALEYAIKKYGKPEIFNSDQGSQFTCNTFLDILKRNGIKISMDGRGRWRDNVIIERFWRSLKYENVYIHDYEAGNEAREGIGAWINFYNNYRPHSSLNGATPEECYQRGLSHAA